MRTLQNLHGVRLGFDPEEVVEVRVNPEPQGYDEERANVIQRELLRAAADVPGAGAVGAAAYGPLRAVMSVDLRRGDAAPDGWPVEAYADHVSPDYFAALYRPLGEHYSNGLTLVVRSTRPPEMTIDPVRALKS